MSYCLTYKDGIKARKAHRCTLCGESIKAGDLQDVRTGVNEGEGFWTMHMHPECRKYECSDARPVDPDWYEDVEEPAFNRAAAIAYAPTNAKETEGGG